MSDEVPDPSKRMVAVPLEEVRRALGKTLVALPRSKVASLRAFRRIRMDRIFGALGLFFVILGIILIFSWEKPPVVEKKFGVQWPQEPHVVQTDSKTLAEGADQAYTLDVPAKNVTSVTFWLTWIDDFAGETSGQSEGDTFQLEFKGPAGSGFESPTRENRTGGKGGMNMSFTFPMSGIPDLASVPARNEAEARAAVGDRSNTTGIGQWTVTVRLLRAGDMWMNDDARELANSRGQSCPANTPNVCTPDPGNSYSFSFEYATYSVAFEKLF